MKIRYIHDYLCLLQPPECVAPDWFRNKLKEEVLNFSEHLKTLKSVGNSRRYNKIKILPIREIPIYEALREKVVILGRFQGILLKFHILKIKFLHEKILFFGVDFFPDKVWLWIVRKWALHRLPKLIYQIGTVTFKYSKN